MRARRPRLAVRRETRIAPIGPAVRRSGAASVCAARRRSRRGRRSARRRAAGGVARERGRRGPSELRRAAARPVRGGRSGREPVPTPAADAAIGRPAGGERHELPVAVGDRARSGSRPPTGAATGERRLGSAGSSSSVERQERATRSGRRPGVDSVASRTRASGRRRTITTWSAPVPAPSSSTMARDDRVGRDRAGQALQDPGERLGLGAAACPRVSATASRSRMAASPTSRRATRTTRSAGRGSADEAQQLDACRGPRR